MIKYPKSVAQFKRQAEAGYRRANPDATDLRMTWTYGPVRCTFPTGIEGFSGVFEAQAAGYRTRTGVASATRETGLSVR